MEKFRTATILLGLSLLGSSNSIALPILFDNEGVIRTAIVSDIAGGQFIFDSFILEDRAKVGGLQWTGAYFRGNSPQSDDFSVRFYENTLDIVGRDIPGTLLREFEVGEANRKDTGQLVGGSQRLNVYSYWIGFDKKFLVDESTKYWVSIVNDTTLDRNDVWGWGGNVPPTEARNADGFASSSIRFPLLRPNHGDTNFQILAAPEPHTVSLIAVGLFLMLSLLERRRVWRIPTRTCF